MVGVLRVPPRQIKLKKLATYTFRVKVLLITLVLRFCIGQGATGFHDEAEISVFSFLFFDQQARLNLSKILAFSHLCIVPFSSNSMETEWSTLSSHVLGFFNPHSMKGTLNFALHVQ